MAQKMRIEEKSMTIKTYKDRIVWDEKAERINWEKGRLIGTFPWEKLTAVKVVYTVQ